MINQFYRIEKNNFKRAVEGQDYCSLYRGPIESPPETPVHHSTIVFRGLRGGLNQDPNMPRYAYLGRQI